MANFFEQQAHARSTTKKLVFLYLLAVASIVGVITAVAHVFIATRVGDDASAVMLDFGVALFVLATIAVGTLVRMIQVGNSGENVAQLLGGTALDTTTTDPLEKRLLNIVEEMAIASGVAVPRVYILRNENGINAFAAGTKPGEAVIGVTRGTLEALTRDELQGVIAHEFSHIFNGDMKLNLRLMGVLGGILALTTIGSLLMQTTRVRSSNSKNDSSAGLVMAGLALYVVGWIGVFFARLIKAAVSRQREYLADSSAVQYTRNPDGIGGALMKIRGTLESSTIRSSYAEEASHMFFGTALNFSSIFATHPQLEDRISRIAPQILAPGAWVAQDAADNERVTAAGVNELAESSISSLQSAPTGLPTAAPTVASVVESIGAPSIEDLEVTKTFFAALPDAIREKTRDPDQALALVISLFLETENGSPKQNLLIDKQLGEKVLMQALRTRTELASLAETARLTLLEISISALREIGLEKKTKLVALAHQLTMADGEVDLYEYVAVTLLEHQLLRGQLAKKPRPTITSARTNGDISILLSSIAYSGADNLPQAKSAFESGLGYLVKAMDQKPTFRELGECELGIIVDVIERLSYLRPNDRKVVIEACVQTILFDRIVTVKESELMRALCTVLEAPLPALAMGI